MNVFLKAHMHAQVHTCTRTQAHTQTHTDGRLFVCFWKSFSSFKSPFLEFLFSIFLMVCVLVTQLCLTLCDSVDYIAHQAPLSMESSRQESAVGCHSLLQGIFSTQESNPVSSRAGRSFTDRATGKPINGTEYKNLPHSFWNCFFPKPIPLGPFVVIVWLVLP